MYTLYYMPGAASFAVHWLLLEIGAPHELRRIDGEAGEQKQPAYLKLNPNGLVPTLVVAGEPVYECAALLLLLAARHPEAHLAPPPGTRAEALYLQWTLHLANTVQPAFRNWFYPDEAAGPEHVVVVKERAYGRVTAAWDRLDAHLAAHGPWVTGSALTAVDFLAAMLARWSRNMPRPATDWPAIARLVAAMKVRPTFRKLNRSEGLTEWL
ncbi:MAG TPA: glutathione S-transferase family protein [Steroidobacteraceae bacterium]|nr:glutathione S-transferase family protein [Steroidobacteraceae bacterium]